MRGLLLHIILILFCVQISGAQESVSTLALELPVRNSLMFNRYAISPTLSFARESNRNIVINNKRELVQTGNSPETYVASFSGRFTEKIGAGIGVFQRNFGVFTTFGGILNFAYNAELGYESNLTFGLNLAAYNSSINSGQVITPVSDPTINNFPSNFVTTISPGINYGGGYIDVGLTVNNLVTYSVSTSELLNEQTQRGIQGHVMYTGYIDSYNFFNNSKFSALGRAEVREDVSIYSGSVMLTVPKGFWVQGGYNTLYGGSAGLGLNITSKIALEYNYERSFGNFVGFGSSHEFTLAFILSKTKSYEFRKKRIVGLLNFEKKRKRSNSNKRLARKVERPSTELSEESIALADEEARLEAEAAARLATEQVLEEERRAVAERQAQIEAETAERLAEERLAAEQDLIEQARNDEGQLQSDAEAKRLERERLAAEEQARLDAEAARQAAADKAEAERLERERLAAEEQARLDAEAARQAAADKAEAERLERERLAAEEQARLDAEAARQAAADKAEAERLERERLAAEEQARLDAENSGNAPTPTDDLGRSLEKLTLETEDIQNSKNDLLDRLQNVVDGKDSDLQDLKNENDLREQGIFSEPKPFKSISEENARLQSLQSELDNIINSQDNKIDELKDVYDRRVKEVSSEDATNTYYKDAIAKLVEERRVTERAKAKLLSSLQRIEEATQFERKRRIKRASFNSEEDRFNQDQERLRSLKENTSLTQETFKEKDFDFGESRSGNMQILRNVENTESAYYLVLAVHKETAKRDEFVKKVIASGNSQVGFFYDINTSKYYIYHDKVNSLQEANSKLGIQDKEAYASKISIIKIEN